MESLSNIIPNLEIKVFGSNLNCIEGMITSSWIKAHKSKFL
jgi:hypothetical protein